MTNEAKIEAMARALREWDWIGTPGFAWDNTRDPERGHWLTMARAVLPTATEGMVPRAVPDDVAGLIHEMSSGYSGPGSQTRRCVEALRSLASTNADLERQLAEAREAANTLNRYVEHKIGCALYQASYAVNFPSCSCGLDDVRAQLAQKSGD